MNANDITFGIKDVAAIVTAVVSILGFLYALKRTAEKANEDNLNLKKNIEDFKATTSEKFLHSKNSKKATVQYIMETMDKKEISIYNKITEIKNEQDVAHNKLWNKLDSVEKMQHDISHSLAELTGYLKAKKI
jgi:hypothetical protein